MTGVRLIVAVAGLLMLISCNSNDVMEDAVPVRTLDLSMYAEKSPEKPIDLLFIHHSCGGQLLADAGPERGDHCIYESHPNGGGLRRLLEENNYLVHEASYTSLVGDKTDICHWNAKFRDRMDRVLTCRHQDEFFTDGTHNRIVMFKSCYPNNWILAQGSPPGDPDDCERTMTNCQAAYSALLEYFRKQPQTLFVAVTAPPLASPVHSLKGRLKEGIKALLRRSNTASSGARARAFNNWLKDIEKGWLKDYELDNVVVFDLYDILTDHGQSNWSRYPTGGGGDSHPSRAGNRKVALEFIPFLNRSVKRMGLEG